MIARLSPPLDFSLVTFLVDEFVSLEQRYIQRDWAPAQLDGGQFCEVLARIIYHVDSGNLNLSKSVDDCLKYVENDNVSHAFNPRHDALHLARVIRTVYKFRSQRGAIHISPNYQPNHMDSKLVVEAVRWAFAEILRMFWTGDRELVAKAIRELLQFDVPCVGKFEEVLMVQRTDLSAEEEILILLHYAGEQGFTRNEIGRYAMHPASTVTTKLQRLESAALRQVVQLGNSKYRLTDLGSRRVREELASKLITQ